MKTFAKLVMLLVVLAMCLPAQGEILIFSKSMNCFWAEGELNDGVDWYYAGEERITGFLILEVVYDYDGKPVEIAQAVQVEYWREGWMERFFEQDEEDFIIERIEVEGPWGRPIVYWVLDSIDNPAEDEVCAVMVRGKAAMSNIGLGWTAEQRREVASSLTGAALVLEIFEGEPDEIEKAICCVTWRLQSWWTRLANHPDVGDQSFEYAEWYIVKDWLLWLGYEEIDGMPL